MIRPIRSLSALVGSLLALASFAACCGSKCIKDPPCCPSKKAEPAKAAKTEAAPMAVVAGPAMPPPRMDVASTARAYTNHGKVYILFTDAGDAEFRKNPESFEEKGAIRVIRKGKTYRTDLRMKLEDEPDWAALAARAVPYAP